MAQVIGKSFEELNDAEMFAVQGGANPGLISTVTSWSSAPCTISAGVVSAVSVVGTIIYTIVN